MPKAIIRKAGEATILPQPWGQLTWYANGDMGNSHELTVGKCVISPGMANPKHMHPNCSEVLVVIEGAIDHAIEDGKTARMEAGETITIPPNLYHNAKNVSEQDALLFITYTSANRETVGE